jgi:ATP-dependent exoDNAse (exonuclease V) alpha subunit
LHDYNKTREDDREEAERGREAEHGSQNQDDEEPSWKFRRVRLLVVDECSLVGVKLFHALLHCLLAHSCLEKLILLGDVNQLPSIEPGE